MKRRLFNLLAGFSLLLLIVVVVDRCSQCWHQHWLEYGFRDPADPLHRRGFAIGTRNGILWFSVSNIHYGSDVPLDPEVPRFGWNIGYNAAQRDANPSGSLFYRMGFGIYGSTTGNRADPNDLLISSRSIAMPNWFAALLLAIVPLIWLRRFRRQRRRRQMGLCPACGYDLRASPGRCPECGEASAKVA